MLQVNPGLIVWTIVTFVLLLAVLRKFAWKPMLGALQRREDTIRGSIERAEDAKRESERILEENKKQLTKAGDESRRILSESRVLAEKLKSEIVEKGNKQARVMIDQARLEIERDKEVAIAQLRGEVADLAIQAAGKILGETLDAARHRKIVDDVIKGLPNN